MQGYISYKREEESGEVTKERGGRGEGMGRRRRGRGDGETKGMRRERRGNGEEKERERNGETLLFIGVFKGEKFVNFSIPALRGRKYVDCNESFSLSTGEKQINTVIKTRHYERLQSSLARG